VCLLADVTHEATPYAVGYRSQTEEVSDRRLPVTGSIPAWLSGSLVRNGPAVFEVGARRVNHWFDGLAMLRRYAIEDGTVRYTNRLLRGEAYAAATEGRAAGGFGTGATGLRKVGRWLRALGPPSPTDNANVHVARLGDRHVALTEVPRWLAFDPRTLETRGTFGFEDNLELDLVTAHLVTDPHRGETVGYGLEFGRRSRFRVFRVPHDGSAMPRRESIGTVPAEGPGYVHSVAVTEDYVVIVEPPLDVALWRALTPAGEGFLDLLEWHPERGTRVLALDRETGETAAETRLSPFFTFHHVNAYQDETGLVLDLVDFADATIVEATGFEVLEGEGFAGVPDGRLARYRIATADPPEGGPLTVTGVERERLYDGGVELPTVAPGVRTREHRYVYGQATDREGANGLVKVDTHERSAREFWERDLYVEEPRFVPRPDGEREDDGVVLAPALDVATEHSELLVFEAASLDLLARAELPHHLPFGFHGRFFSDGV
jgi:carotenoid cleavage dioxygenase-like enzyme